MASTIWQALGSIFFWVSWPAQFVLVPFTKRARIIVLSENNKLLLVRVWHGNGLYTLPGGGIKPYEDEYSAAKRELAEETGIRPSMLTKIDNFKSRTHGVLSNITVFKLTLVAQPSIISRPLEITDHIWLHKNQIAKDIRVHPEARKIYLKYGKI